MRRGTSRLLLLLFLIVGSVAGSPLAVLPVDGAATGSEPRVAEVGPRDATGEAFAGPDVGTSSMGAFGGLRRVAATGPQNGTPGAEDARGEDDAASAGGETNEAEASSSEESERIAPPELPTSPPYWLAAILPLLLLLFLLMVPKWDIATAAAIALFLSVAIASTLFQTPLRTLAVATGKAMWDAFFILYVVWPALLIYSVAREAGAYARIERTLEKRLRSDLLLVLALAWVFPSFVQGMAGEGVPLAITIPILVRLGVKPLYAVLLPLIGRTWANIYGSLGEGWLVVERAVDLSDPQLTIVLACLLLWIPNLMGGIGIAWIYGRWRAVRRGAVAIGAISLLHGGLQLAVAPFYPSFGVFVAASLALLAVLGLSRWGPYAHEDEESPDRIFERGIGEAREDGPSGDEDPGDEAGAERKEAGEDLSIWAAAAPYLVLTTAAILALVVGPVRSFLEQVRIGLPFPGTETGFGIAREATESYEPFAVLTHPGTLLLLTAIASYAIYRAVGAFDGRSNGRIARRAFMEAVSATTPFVAIVLIAKIMELSGQVLVLGSGVASVTSPTVYVALANWIGGLGAQLADSTSASMVLFTPLQALVAQSLDLSVALIVAAQAAGASISNAAAGMDILIGLLVVGKPQLLGKVLLSAEVWVVLVHALASVGTLLLFWFVV